MAIKSLYLDNYRGFTKALINFESTTFLVGENSTGKTSVLSLVYLLCQPEFFTTLDFNTEPIALGNFHDIASPGAKTFRVATEFNADDNPLKTKGPAFTYLDMTFRDQDGMTTVANFRCFSYGSNLSFKVDGDHLSYLIEKKEHEPFESWLRNDKVESWAATIEIQKYRTQFRTYFLIDHIIRHFTSKNKNIDFVPALIPWIGPPVSWIAPIRAKARRTYDSYRASFSPEGEHAPYVLNNILHEEKALPDSAKHLTSSLRNFGKASGLFRAIRPKRLGPGQSAPFELQVALSNHAYKLSSVGYGVQQILPILVELLSGDHAREQLCLQQPEIHLHPKAQAALGDLLLHLAVSSKRQFIVETHSDFLIDRYRLAMTTADKPPPSQVVFFTRSPSGNHATPVAIHKDGRYSEEQPQEFRSFFLQEDLRLFRL